MPSAIVSVGRCAFIKLQRGACSCCATRLLTQTNIDTTYAFLEHQHIQRLTVADVRLKSSLLLMLVHLNVGVLVLDVDLDSR